MDKIHLNAYNTRIIQISQINYCITIVLYNKNIVYSKFFNTYFCTYGIFIGSKILFKCTYTFYISLLITDIGSIHTLFLYSSK